MSDFRIPTKHMPKINRTDTYHFTKNVGDVAVQSVGYRIIDPSGTTVVSLGTASQSGTSTNWNFFYTTPNSWYTTTKTVSIWQAEWNIFRTTGNDKEIDYFETVTFDFTDSVT